MASIANVVETRIGQLRRQSFKPRIPNELQDLTKLKFSLGNKTEAIGNADSISQLFPITYGQPIIDITKTNDDNKENNDNNNNLKRKLTIGVVLSGGQASGGHNVITGLFDGLKELNNESTLIGFLNGPIGVMKNKFINLDSKIIDLYRNTGGFDMIASGRDKIETEEQRKEALNTVNKNNLDGLVVIGGDDSNTNAAVLAEYFKSNGSKCSVVGCPKTIDGDLQNEYIEMSFGFDTAVKVFSEMISNICRDAVSAAKTWHFVKLMGRDASQVTLDCALQTHPNFTMIGEYVQAKRWLLHDLTEMMVDVIEKRGNNGKDYGVILIPEGIISFIPSMKGLINDLNEMLKVGSQHLVVIESLNEFSEKVKYIRSVFEKEKKHTSLQNFDVLPRDIQAQMLLERDPHGNIQMSQIPIENLFIQIATQKLAQRKTEGTYKGKFRGQGHFYGYDGRSGFPSNFDAQYCYNLGRTATILLSGKHNGYMSRVYDLEKDVKEWKAGGIPITMLMNMERRHGVDKPVIRKALVKLDGNKFQYFKKKSENEDWGLNDCYRYVGPIQLFGPQEITDEPPINVLLKKTNNVVWPIGNNYNKDTDVQTEQKSDQ